MPNRPTNATKEKSRLRAARYTRGWRSRGRRGGGTVGGIGLPRSYLNETGEERRWRPSPFPFACCMEARGIEPRSERDSDSATTCVDDAFLSSRHLGASSALAATSLYLLLRNPLRPWVTPARLCDA